VFSVSVSLIWLVEDSNLFYGAKLVYVHSRFVNFLNGRGRWQTSNVQAKAILSTGLLSCTS
jgi:hypothetical protein